MKKILTITTISLLLSLFSIAHAQDRSSGCGPGWYVASEQSLVSSALRAVTNGILWPTTTGGMTMGTSNCSKHKLVKTEKESLHFATHNYFELKRETALGQGEFLSTFATTLGCAGNHQELFSVEMQRNFGKLFPSDRTEVSPEDLLLQTYITILSNRELTQSCSLG